MNARLPPSSRFTTRFFDAHDADWVCLLDEKNGPAEILADRRQDYLSKICRAQLLTEPPDQLSVIGVSFAPEFQIATHYHDVDQFLLVTKGEFRMGRRRLHPGQGAYMPAGNPYNAQVGRAGGAFLEFRAAPFYRTAFIGHDAQHVGAAAPSVIDGWPKPSPKLGRTTFFDAETQMAIDAPGFGPGDGNAAMPESIAAALRYQVLHAGPGFSMHGVIAAAALHVPVHQQDADKVIYLLAGAMDFQAGDRQTLRPGGGVFVPAGTPVSFRSAAAGVRFLEFRTQAAWRTRWPSA